MVTQPSVSSAIAALGRELGCELFERAGRGIRLTEAGQAFRPYAEDVVGLLDDGRQAAREAADVAARRMRIAAVTTAAESFVPPLMRGFTARHPDVELTLDVGNREYVFERVLSHLADVAISGKPPADERLVAEPLLENHIACITGPDDPLAAAGPVAAGELAHRAWLLREPGSGTRALGEQFLERSWSAPEHPHARLQRRDQAGGPGRARRIAAVAGGGRGRAGGGLARARSRSATAPSPGRGSCCAQRSVPLRPAAATFIEFVRAEASDARVARGWTTHSHSSIATREIRT